MNLTSIHVLPMKKKYLLAFLSKKLLKFDSDSNIKILFDKSGANCDVEFFASGGEDDEEEDNESNESADEDAPLDPLEWLNTLSDINVEEFSVHHGPTKDLGGQARSKDFLNLFINDDYLDEIARCSVAYAPSKGDESFVTNRAEISRTEHFNGNSSPSPTGYVLGF